MKHFLFFYSSYCVMEMCRNTQIFCH
jgi:hypothetical protein